MASPRKAKDKQCKLRRNTMLQDDLFLLPQQAATLTMSPRLVCELNIRYRHSSASVMSSIDDGRIGRLSLGKARRRSCASNKVAVGVARESRLGRGRELLLPFLHQMRGCALEVRRRQTGEVGPGQRVALGVTRPALVGHARRADGRDRRVLRVVALGMVAGARDGAVAVESVLIVRVVAAVGFCRLCRSVPVPIIFEFGVGPLQLALGGLYGLNGVSFFIHGSRLGLTQTMFRPKVFADGASSL
jgi:hypothetical protein